MMNSKMVGLLVVAFVAGSFVASPELRAYAANTVFSTDIVDGEVKTSDLAANAVTAAKIKDAEVKAAEIATDAVGAAELQGVTKLLFGKCILSSAENSLVIPSGDGLIKICNISGVDSNDFAIASLTEGNGAGCFSVGIANAVAGGVQVIIRNVCSFNAAAGPAGAIGIMVFDK